MTQSTLSRWTVTVAGAALLGLSAPATGPAVAQQQDADRAAGDREERPGWIGVGLGTAYRCHARTEAADEEEREDGQQVFPRLDCRKALVAQALVDGGPADRAGLMPGDTIVAVNGHDVSTREGRQELVSFRPGEAVTVQVGRPGGRTSVRVVPEPRPPEKGPVPLRFAREAPAASVRALPAPTSPEVTVPFAPTVDVAGHASLRFSGIRLGQDGSVYLEREDGELIALEELEAMAPKLKEIQDSVLVQARKSLRDLRRHKRWEGGGEEDAPTPPFAQMPSPARGAHLRAAGAEFRPLTPELAEYFPGARDGLLVLQVLPGTPAARLGLRSGDVVVEAAGRSITGASDLRASFGRYPTQDSVIVKWIRKGEPMEGVLRNR